MEEYLELELGVSGSVSMVKTPADAAFCSHSEAGFGDLILIVRDGRVSAETHSSGMYS